MASELGLCVAQSSGKEAGHAKAGMALPSRVVRPVRQRVIGPEPRSDACVV